MTLTEAHRRALEADDWFGALPADSQARLLSAAVMRRVPGGARLYAAGDPPNGLWGVLEGQVRLVGYPASGLEVLVRIIGAGAWFGELSTLDAGPRPQDAVAFGPAAMLHVSMPAFARLAQTHPTIYRDIGLLSCVHQRAALAFIGQRVAQPIGVRLARALHNASREAGAEPRLTIRQAELAVLVGVSRQTLNRALKALERTGVVTVGYASIDVRDPVRLRAMSGVNEDLVLEDL